MAVLSIGGCSILNPKPLLRLKRRPRKHRAKNSSNPDVKSATAVENAIIWSDKYTKLSDANGTGAEKKSRPHRRKSESDQLRLPNLKRNSIKLKKELAEANTLLVDMQKELTNWKSDVLGFRDEMRKAQKAQIDALTHIIILLGGETPSPAMDANTAKHAESKTDEPNKSK